MSDKESSTSVVSSVVSVKDEVDEAQALLRAKSDMLKARLMATGLFDGSTGKKDKDDEVGVYKRTPTTKKATGESKDGMNTVPPNRHRGCEKCNGPTLNFCPLCKLAICDPCIIAGGWCACDARTQGFTYYLLPTGKTAEI